MGHRLPRRPPDRGRGRPAAARWCASRSRSASASRSWTTGAARSSPPAPSRTSSRSGTPRSRSTPSTTRRRRARSRRSSRRCWPRRAGPSATVKHEAKNIGGSGQQLSFIIDEGPKAKVHEIVFEGNQVFPDGTLRGRMKKVKQPGFFNLSWLGGKTTYTEDKWLGGEEDPRGDRGRLEDYYLEPRLRHGADRAAEDQLHRRQERLLQEEADQADAARDPGDRGASSTGWGS